MNRSEERAAALLAAAEKSARSIRGVISDVIQSERAGASETRIRWHLHLERPNRVALVRKDGGEDLIRAIVSDGRTRREYTPDGRVAARPAEREGRKLVYGFEVLEALFDPSGFVRTFGAVVPRHVDQERTVGALCDVIELRDTGSPTGIARTLRLYLDPAQRVLKVTTEADAGDAKTYRASQLSQTNWWAIPRDRDFVYPPVRPTEVKVRIGRPARW